MQIIHHRNHRNKLLKWLKLSWNSVLPFQGMCFVVVFVLFLLRLSSVKSMMQFYCLIWSSFRLFCSSKIFSQIITICAIFFCSRKRKNYQPKMSKVSVNVGCFFVSEFNHFSVCLECMSDVCVCVWCLINQSISIDWLIESIHLFWNDADWIIIIIWHLSFKIMMNSSFFCFLYPKIC